MLKLKIAKKKYKRGFSGDKIICFYMRVWCNSLCFHACVTLHSEPSKIKAFESLRLIYLDPTAAVDSPCSVMFVSIDYGQICADYC